MAVVDLLRGARVTTTSGGNFFSTKNLAIGDKVSTSDTSKKAPPLFQGQDVFYNDTFAFSAPTEANARLFFLPGNAVGLGGVAGAYIARVFQRAYWITKIDLMGFTAADQHVAILRCIQGGDPFDINSYVAAPIGGGQGTAGNEVHTSGAGNVTGIVFNNPVPTRALMFKNVNGVNYTGAKIYANHATIPLINELTSGDDEKSDFFIEAGDSTAIYRYDMSDLAEISDIYLLGSFLDTEISVSTSTDDATYTPQTVDDDTVTVGATTTQTYVVLAEEADAHECFIFPRTLFGGAAFNFPIDAGLLSTIELGLKGTDVTVWFAIVRDLGSRFIRVGYPAGGYAINVPAGSITTKVINALNYGVYSNDYLAMYCDFAPGGTLSISLTGVSAKPWNNLIAYGDWDLTAADSANIGDLTRGAGTLANMQFAYNFNRSRVEFGSPEAFRYMKVTLPAPAAGRTFIKAFKAIATASKVSFYGQDAGGSVITEPRPSRYTPGTFSAPFSVYVQNDTGEEKSQCLASPTYDPNSSGAANTQVSFDGSSWVVHCLNNNINALTCSVNNNNYGKKADPQKAIAGCGRGCTIENGVNASGVGLNGTTAPTGGFVAPTPATLNDTIGSGDRVEVKVRSKFPTGSASYSGRIRASFDRLV